MWAVSSVPRAEKNSSSLLFFLFLSQTPCSANRKAPPSVGFYFQHLTTGSSKQWTGRGCFPHKHWWYSASGNLYSIFFYQTDLITCRLFFLLTANRVVIFKRLFLEAFHMISQKSNCEALCGTQWTVHSLVQWFHCGVSICPALPFIVTLSRDCTLIC